MKTQEKGQFIILMFGAYLLGSPFDVLKLDMKIILLFKPDPMVDSACLCSKPFRNESYSKMAIIHHENSKERPFYHHFVYSITPRLLTRFFKTKYEYYTTPQARSNGGIRVSVL